MNVTAISDKNNRKTNHFGIDNNRSGFERLRYSISICGKDFSNIKVRKRQKCGKPYVEECRRKQRSGGENKTEGE